MFSMDVFDKAAFNNVNLNKSKWNYDDKDAKHQKYWWKFRSAYGF